MVPCRERDVAITRHVLLLHENDLAALFLGDLIRLLISKGWKVISLEAAYADPISSDAPGVLFNNQGRVAAIARSQGIAERALVQDSAEED